MALVSAVTFHYVLRAIEEKTSLPIEEMLRIVEISPDVFQKEGTSIDSKKLTKAFKYAIGITKDPNLALHIGKSIPYQSLGILGYLLSNVKDVKELITKFSHYQKLIGGYLKFHFEEDEKYYTIAIYINENPLIPVPSYHAEVHLSAIISILNRISGIKIIPYITHFSHDKPMHIDEYRDLFGEKLFFNREKNAIFFHKEKLSTPINNSNPTMLEFFEAQAKRILTDLEDTTIYSKVKRVIFKNIGECEISVEFIAKELGFGVRTLQNHLKAEEKTFRDAYTSVRKELANHYIKNTEIDYGIISVLLGYSEPSAFFRAYKKWYNMTPTEYRSTIF